MGVNVWFALGGGLVMDTAFEVCKVCEHSLPTCPYFMALARCPKVRDAVLKKIDREREEELVEKRKVD